jgi:hypothetical protein
VLEQQQQKMFPENCDNLPSMPADALEAVALINAGGGPLCGYWSPDTEAEPGAGCLRVCVCVCVCVPVCVCVCVCVCMCACACACMRGTECTPHINACLGSGMPHSLC